MARVLVAMLLAAAAWVDPSPHRDGFVTNAGVKLHYLDWGGRGPVLLLVPGHDQTAHIFDDLAPRLRDRARVIALDRRGHGRSDAPSTGYDLPTLSSDITTLLDRLGSRQAILAGHSFGGLEITDVAERHPARVSGVVYIDGAYEYSHSPAIWAADPIAIAPSEADNRSLASARLWFERVFGFWSAAVEADARAANLQADGTMRTSGLRADVNDALMRTLTTAQPRFDRVRAPVLAFFAVTQQHPFVGAFTPEGLAAEGQRYWQTVFLPDLRRQIAAFRAAQPAARIVELDTQHLCFIRQRDADVIVAEMREFLRR